MSGFVHIGWRAIDGNPNSAEALRQRQATLERSYAGHPLDKEAYLLQHAEGRRVLDLGCAGQNKPLTDPRWLHGRIAGTAEYCLGADYEQEAVDEIRRAGFDAVTADVSDPPDKELLDRGPFDLVVAAELIEHLAAPQSLFDFAASLLGSDGLLLLTTPNPFALQRVAAGRRGFNRDNCDHVVLAFPSGIVELAERTGFELVTHSTTPLRRRRLTAVQALRSELGRLRRLTWNRPYAVPPLLDVLGSWRRWDGGLLGETAIYLCRRVG